MAINNNNWEEEEIRKLVEMGFSEELSMATVECMWWKRGGERVDVVTCLVKNDYKGYKIICKNEQEIKAS